MSKQITITLTKQQAKHLRHVLDAASKPISPKIAKLKRKV